MNFDLVYQQIGELGRYQKYILVLSAYTSLYSGLIFISSFFVLEIPKHRCAIPGLVNDTYAVQNDFHQSLINLTIPPAEPNDDDEVYDKCHTYTTDGFGPYGGVTGINATSVINRTTITCDRWVYDVSVFKSTLAAELNMVCGRAVLKSTGQMIFFLGVLTGSFLTGIVSDSFGHKKTLCSSSTCYLISAMCIAWTPSYAIYLLLIFAVGFFSAGTFLPAYVVGMELTGPSRRRFAGQLSNFFWTLGNLILAFLGYANRDWTKLQTACAAPGIVFLSYWILYPESQRWLYTHGKLKESEKVIRKAAKVNKVQLTEKFFEKVFRSPQEAVPVGRLWQLFSSKTLAIRTSIIYFNWLVVTMVYYGLALNSGDLGGDIFMNFFLQSLMDIPALVVVVVLLDRVGRKPIQVCSMIFGGVACLSTIFTIIYGGIELQWLTRTLAMLGKLGASAGYSMVYQYSAELFPTVVRNAGMGSSSCMARIGGMIAPYIADLDRLIGGDVGKTVPLLIFGSLSVVAGMLAFHLPETLRKHLPETIEDGEKFGTEAYMKGKADTICLNKAFDDEEETAKDDITEDAKKDIHLKTYDNKEEPVSVLGDKETELS